MLKTNDLVVMHTCGEAEYYKGRIWVCRGNEFTSSAGQQVVFLEGFSGSFLVEYLQIVKFDFSYKEFLEDETNYEKLINEHAELAHFKEIALKHLTPEQLECIEENMENIPEMGLL